MSMETEFIKVLDSVAFEESTTDEQKLNSIQNLLYQFEQIQTARSISAEEEYFTEGFRR